MDGPGPKPQIDARAARFELAAMAVVLLGAFVFKKVWVVPGLAVVVAVGLTFGSRANLFSELFRVLVADRLKPATATELETVVRFSELFAVVVLTIATVLFALDLSLLGWPVALVEAGVCALHAMTGLSVEAAVRDRFLGRRRG
jgi:hypothetical protein